MTKFSDQLIEITYGYDPSPNYPYWAKWQDMHCCGESYDDAENHLIALIRERYKMKPDQQPPMPKLVSLAEILKESE